MKIGKERILLETVDSTNSYAFSLALGGCPDGTVIVADAQTKGRGRHGRVWHSPKGKNIYMSIILRSPQKDSISLLSLMAAIAVSEAIEEKTSVPVRVKWPNDIMISDNRGFRKVGGILSEARFSGDNPEFVILGIGINVNSEREDLPPDLIDRATTLKVVVGKDINREGLLEGILGFTDKWYSLLCKGHKERMLNRWRELSLTIGKEVMAIKEKGVIKGKALDIDEEGRLLLCLPSGRVERISSPEVIHLQ